jgi:hypothetical protein
MKIFYILIPVSLTVFSATLYCVVTNTKSSSPDEIAYTALENFFNCIDTKHSEAACTSETEKAYQALSKADVMDDHKIRKDLQSTQDCGSQDACEELNFKRVAASCAATIECETYSCLNKNLWRCK